MARLGRVLTKPETPTTTLTQAHSKLQTAILAVETSIKTCRIARNWYKNRFSYNVLVSEDEPVYREIQDWVMRIFVDDRPRMLNVVTEHSNVNHNSPVSESSSSDEGPSKLTVRINDDLARVVQIEGHKVEITFFKPDMSDKSEAYMMRYEPKREVMFRTYSIEAQQAVLRLLDKLNAGRATTRKANLKMMNQWGNWRTRSDLPPRTMDSVVLPDEQKKRIVTDLRNFLEAEEKYNRLAIPWHRGYMFHGPPGTGKTSIVKALANEFNLDLWYISLSDFKAETGLLSSIADVTPRSILLLEDIDTVKITHDRDGDSEGSDPGNISLSALLNTLDGVATPHGLITMMTTNHFDALDPALVRAGRMDMIEELGYPTQQTVKDLFKYFYGQNLVFKREESWMNKVSTSQVAEIMKRNFEDPNNARKELVELLFIKGENR